MAAAAHNFVIEQGATFNPVLRLVEKTTQNPIDITGSDFKMQIREEDQDGTVIVELSITNSRIVIVDASDGKFQLVLTDTETDAFTADQFQDAVYDLEWKDSAGVVKRLLQGCVGLVLNITRPGV